MFLRSNPIKRESTYHFSKSQMVTQKALDDRIIELFEEAQNKFSEETFRGFQNNFSTR